MKNGGILLPTCTTTTLLTWRLSWVVQQCSNNVQISSCWISDRDNHFSQIIDTLSPRDDCGWARVGADNCWELRDSLYEGYDEYVYSYSSSELLTM